MRSRYHQAIDLNSLPTKTARQKENAMMENETMKCPVCAEEINAEAVKCRFCGEMLNNSPEISRPTTIPRQSESRRTGRFLLVGLLSILLPGGLMVCMRGDPGRKRGRGHCVGYSLPEYGIQLCHWNILPGDRKEKRQSTGDGRTCNCCFSFVLFRCCRTGVRRVRITF